jgi:hypothetical protein
VRIEQRRGERQPTAHVLERVEPDHAHVADGVLSQLAELALPVRELPNRTLQALDGLAMGFDLGLRPLVRRRGLDAPRARIPGRDPHGQIQRQQRHHESEKGDDGQRGI